MKKLISTVLITAAFCQPLYADDSVDHSGQASKHSALASIEASKVTASVASAAVAVPVLIVGGTAVSVAHVSHEAMKDLHQASEKPKPLPITDKVITCDPSPNQVIINQTTMND